MIRGSGLSANQFAAKDYAIQAIKGDESEVIEQLPI